MKFRKKPVVIEASMNKRVTMQTVKVPVIHCSTCAMPYVLRRTVGRITSESPEYMYQRDCKHYTPMIEPSSADDLEVATLMALTDETNEVSMSVTDRIQGLYRYLRRLG